MSSRKRPKRPCPGCHEVSWDLSSNQFSWHFRHNYNKRFLEDVAPASANRSHVTYDSHSNTSVPRNLLLASDTLTSSMFAENPFESERSPADPRRSTDTCRQQDPPHLSTSSRHWNQTRCSQAEGQKTESTVRHPWIHAFSNSACGHTEETRMPNENTRRNNQPSQQWSDNCQFKRQKPTPPL